MKKPMPDAFTSRGLSTLGKEDCLRNCSAKGLRPKPPRSPAGQGSVPGHFPQVPEGIYEHPKVQTIEPVTPGVAQ